MIYIIYIVSVYNLNDYYFLVFFILLILVNLSIFKYYDFIKNRREWIVLNFEWVNLCMFIVVN